MAEEEVADFDWVLLLPWTLPLSEPTDRNSGSVGQFVSMSLNEVLLHKQ